MSRPFTLVAKAAGSGEGAENTCEAVARAVSVRLPSGTRLAVEIDLRLSADRALVAIHDADVARTTNGRGPVRDLTQGELCALRAGAAGERIPLLGEIFDAAGDAELVLDVHDASRAMAEELLAALRGLGPSALERVLVASEHGAFVRALRALDARLRTAATPREAWSMLLCDRLKLARFAPRGHTWLVPELHRRMRVVTRSFAENATRGGDDLWVYVVDDVRALRRLRGMGVTGCFTTRPAELAAELSRYA